MRTEDEYDDKAEDEEMGRTIRSGGRRRGHALLYSLVDEGGSDEEVKGENFEDDLDGPRELANDDQPEGRLLGDAFVEASEFLAPLNFIRAAFSVNQRSRQIEKDTEREKEGIFVREHSEEIRKQVK